MSVRCIRQYVQLRHAAAHWIQIHLMVRFICAIFACRYELEVWGERHDVERGDVLRSLEWSQKFFAAVDPVGQYGNLYRCALANGEHRWLCPYHAAHAKGEVELARPPPLRTVC